MADLSLTAGNVVPQSSATPYIKQAYFGETITAGMPIYLDSNGLMWKADADNTSKLDCRGVALQSGAAGQPGSYASKGLVAYGAILTAGMLYVVSTTAGGIRPISDVASTEYIIIVGKAATTANLDILAEGARLLQVAAGTAADVASGADVT